MADDRRPNGGTGADRSALARSIVDGSLYMVIATADESGRPWASPVYFAVDDYRDFFWVSSLEAQHSRNIALRPGVGIVVFGPLTASLRQRARRSLRSRGTSSSTTVLFCTSRPQQLSLCGRVRVQRGR